MDENSLSLVIAYIQPFQLDSVVEALRHLPHCPGMSVSEVRGVGWTGANPPRKGEKAEVDPFEDKVRIEILCRGPEAAAIMEAVRSQAHTGHRGDGKIFAMPVTLAQRIRTGEWGDAAL